MLALALFIVTVIGVLAAPLIILATAPGFTETPGKFDLTVSLLRVTFPYIFFISLTALAGGILNTYSRFAVPAVTPTLLNLSFIGFALWGAPYFDPPVKALAWAVFAGGIAQLTLQVPFLARLGLLPRFRLSLRDAGVWRILRQLRWSVQQPVGRALERNEARIQDWQQRRWPEIKKKPRKRAGRSSSSTKAV